MAIGVILGRMIRKLTRSEEENEEIIRDNNVDHAGCMGYVWLPERANQRSGAGQIDRTRLQRGECVSIVVEGSRLEGIEV